MSKRLLSFFLKELETIRIHCSSSACGGVIEFPTKQLQTLKPKSISCPVCGAPFQLSNGTLIQLGLDIEQLRNANMEIEFVLPDNSDAPATK